MKQYPTIPTVDEAPTDIFESGHLWLLELIDGAHLRFQLLESGALRFGDRDRVYDDPDSIPDAYEHAVRHVRERLDRDALRNAVETVESVVFFGEATHRQTIAYDWDRIPSFLGFDVYSVDSGSFRPPGAVQGIYERLGLQPVNAVERELHTRDFDPDSYTIPESAWYDGPAAGVVIRNKRGGRAKLLHPTVQEADAASEATSPIGMSADRLAERVATDERLGRIRRELEGRDGPPSFETVFERTMSEIAREHHARLFHPDSSIDRSELRSAVAKRIRSSLESE